MRLIFALAGAPIRYMSVDERLSEIVADNPSAASTILLVPNCEERPPGPFVSSSGFEIVTVNTCVRGSQV